MLIILEANGRHVLTDSWTSLGVVGGLCLVLLTGWRPFDPLFAIMVSDLCKGCAECVFECPWEALEMAQDFPGFAPSAIAAIEDHDWPGNVRELRNFAQRLAHRSMLEAPDEPVRFDPAALDPFASPWRPGAGKPAATVAA